MDNKRRRHRPLHTESLANSMKGTEHNRVRRQFAPDPRFRHHANLPWQLGEAAAHGLYLRLAHPEYECLLVCGACRLDPAQQV
jgi:hypothetical protein